MKHFVITRIGIGIYDQKRSKKMIDLFKSITFPSLLNQLNQNFTSLIVIDANLGQKNIDYLKEIIKGKTNFYIVTIDVTNLTNVHTGCFDWIWDKCQNFIIENQLIDNINEYAMTSVLDADDAWHKSLVELIENTASKNLNLISTLEVNGTTWTRHSSGLVLTITNGHAFYVNAKKISKMKYKFHSMAVFVLSRFSSGISVCSSRHSQWEHYAKVVDFKVGVMSETNPMWLYSRHDEGVVPWDATNANEITNEMELKITKLFGIDFNLIKKWNDDYQLSTLSNYKGKPAKDQYDLIFKISILNRAIESLKNNRSPKVISELTGKRKELIRSLQSI